MALTLKIENETRLMDGGPLEFSVAGNRGFDIGRDSYLDWTLPDSSRRISGKHCEVRYRDNGYWLHDVSTNGTFLNGNDRRMSEPYRLKNGDRIVIGHYIILVSVSGETSDDSEPQYESPSMAANEDMWSPRASSLEPATAPPPLGKQPLIRPGPNSAPVTGQADFLDWMADIPPLMPDRSLDQPNRLPPDHATSQASPANDSRLPSTQPANSALASMPASSALSFWDDHTPTQPHPDPDDDWSVPIRSAERLPNRPAESRPVENGAPQRRSAPFEPPELRPMPDERPAPPPPAIASAPGASDISASQQRTDGRTDEFIAALASAAGIPPTALAHYSAERLGHVMGELLRITVTELGVLLAGRFEAKRVARSSHQTQIGGEDNNPIKFLPTVSDTIAVMLGPPNPSYLDARRTLQSSFEDIKTHQLDTFVAMQAALLELADDLDPSKIEDTAQDSGLSGLVGSRKSRAWDIYAARWKANTTRHENGLLGAFTEYFSKHYDRG